MLKNIIFLLLFTLALVFGSVHIHPFVVALLSTHDWISQLLLQVFAGGQIGSIIRQVIAAITLPLIIGLIPSLVYYMAKKKAFPYFMHITWALWLIQSTAMIMRASIV